MEEAAELATLARRLRAYRELLQGAYAFFSFGMVIAGAFLVAAASATLLSLRGPALALLYVASIGGSAAAASIVMGRVFGDGVLSGRDAAIGAGVFASFYALIYALSITSPHLASLAPVAWFPGLGLYFVVLYALELRRGDPGAAVMRNTGLAILGLSPPVLIASFRSPGAAAALALGLVLLIYHCVGTYLMYRANRMFE